MYIIHGAGDGKALRDSFSVHQVQRGANGFLGDSHGDNARGDIVDRGEVHHGLGGVKVWTSENGAKLCVCSVWRVLWRVSLRVTCKGAEHTHGLLFTCTQPTRYRLT